MEVKKNPELYRKMLYLIQWHKYDRLLAIRTGVTRKHLYIEMFDVYNMYKMWHYDTASYYLSKEKIKVCGG